MDLLFNRKCRQPLRNLFPHSANNGTISATKWFTNGRLATESSMTYRIIQFIGNEWWSANIESTTIHLRVNARFLRFVENWKARGISSTDNKQGLAKRRK